MHGAIYGLLSCSRAAQYIVQASILPKVGLLSSRRTIGVTIGIQVKQTTFSSLIGSCQRLLPRTDELAGPSTFQTRMSGSTSNGRYSCIALPTNCTSTSRCNSLFLSIFTFCHLFGLSPPILKLLIQPLGISALHQLGLVPSHFLSKQDLMMLPPTRTSACYSQHLLAPLQHVNAGCH